MPERAAEERTLTDFCTSPAGLYDPCHGALVAG